MNVDFCLLVSGGFACSVKKQTHCVVGNCMEMVDAFIAARNVMAP